MEMLEFFDWAILGTFAGATFAVAILTQFTKSIPGISKVPTQVWSYILAVIVLIGAKLFAEELTLAEGLLAVVNAALVSLSANGGYEAIARIKNGVTTEKTE